MSGKRERTVIGLIISISVIMLIVVAILAIVDRHPAEETHTEFPKQTQTRHHDRRHSQSESPGKSASEPAKESQNGNLQKALKEPTLKDIIRTARTWEPAFTHWYGSTATDFTLTDTSGKQHKLSDYYGKNVILVFWGTWCGPCIMEIPHLIELRNTVGEDKLAILAISKEDPDLVKKFVYVEKINYTVLLSKRNMPAPYDYVDAIPCSFFIDPKGKIKLSTMGLLSLDEMKAILRAK